MPSASIDIGSNSILLLVRGDDGRILHDESQVVGLGQGLGDRGLLRSDRMDAAIKVLETFAQRARELGLEPGQIQAAGTSAMRRALNASTFTDRIYERIGVDVRIISGEDEAKLTATGAISGLQVPRGIILVVDPGGGSTELVRVRHDPGGPAPALLLTKTSLEIGTVRLTESHLGTGVVRPQTVAQTRTDIETALATVDPSPWPRAVVAVAGTATALAAAHEQLTRFDTERIHGVTIELSTLRGWVDRLRLLDRPGREALLPASPERADTILAGTLVLEHVLTWCHRPSLVVSSRGLRFGLLDNPLPPTRGRR